MSEKNITFRMEMPIAVLSRNERGKTIPSDRLLEQVYGFAFDNKIKLGRLKEMLLLEKQ